MKKKIKSLYLTIKKFFTLTILKLKKIFLCKKKKNARSELSVRDAAFAWMETTTGETPGWRVGYSAGFFLGRWARVCGDDIPSSCPHPHTVNPASERQRCGQHPPSLPSRVDGLVERAE